MSVKQLSPDPFEHIENYELNKIYKVKVVKLMDFGAFVIRARFNFFTSLKWIKLDKKNYLPKNVKVGDEIDCVILRLIKRRDELQYLIN